MRNRLFCFVCSMSFRELVFLYTFMPAGMLALLYFYARCLMLKAVFIRQLDAMHARLEQGQPLEGIGVAIEPIPWQTAIDEATVRTRSRIVRHYLVHPAYRDAVAFYQALEARLNRIMLLIVLASGVLLALV